MIVFSHNFYLEAGIYRRILLPLFRRKAMNPFYMFSSFIPITVLVHAVIGQGGFKFSMDSTSKPARKEGI